MTEALSNDQDVNHLFERVRSNMESLFGYSSNEAWDLIKEYTRLFRDVAYCASIGIGVQDDDYFFHEAPMGMAMRVHYYLGMKADPSPRAFLLWRKELTKQLASKAHGSPN